MFFFRPAGPSPGFARWPPRFVRGLPQKLATVSYKNAIQQTTCQDWAHPARYLQSSRLSGPIPLAIYSLPASLGTSRSLFTVFPPLRAHPAHYLQSSRLSGPIPLGIHSFATFSSPAVHFPLSILGRLLDRVALGRDSRLPAVLILG